MSTEKSTDQEKSNQAVDALFHSMKEALKRGERIELRGSGVFVVKPRKRGVGRNLLMAEEVAIPSVIERLECLTPVQQGKLLDFLNSLDDANVSKGARRSLRGLFKDLGVTISEEDIDEARREMWGNFPRDIS